MKAKIELPNRFYSLDALRGIAALAVVLWHWQHFFFNGTVPPQFNRADQPLFTIFYLFYEQGLMAVNLFYSLSGFIFFWLYSKRISENKISPVKFFALRFSRLYPLHILTLTIVLIGQVYTLNSTGDFFVYSHNDLYHFILQTFFISHWGLQTGVSFNGPSWSISVEVFIYLIFFAICFIKLNRWWAIGILTGIGFTLDFIMPNFRIFFGEWIGEGMLSFFSGGLTYYFFSEYFLIDKSRWIIPITTLTSICWILTFIESKYGLLQFFLFNQWHDIFIFGKVNYIHTAIYYVKRFYCLIVLFPLTIFTLALLETTRGSLGKKVSFLGDISYSTYLLHFPLQIIFINIATQNGMSFTLFYSKMTLLIFFTILISISLISFHYFERPIQKKIRKLLATHPTK